MNGPQYRNYVRELDRMLFGYPSGEAIENNQPPTVRHAAVRVINPDLKVEHE